MRARYEPSHLDVHCLHRYWFSSAGLEGFGVYNVFGKVLSKVPMISYSMV